MLASSPRVARKCMGFGDWLPRAAFAPLICPGLLYSAPMGLSIGVRRSVFVIFAFFAAKFIRVHLWLQMFEVLASPPWLVRPMGNRCATGASARAMLSQLAFGTPRGGARPTELAVHRIACRPGALTRRTCTIYELGSRCSPLNNKPSPLNHFRATRAVRVCESL